MSQDAICTALPYAQCESPIPEAGVPSPLPQTTLAMLDLSTRPPTLIQEGDGTKLGMPSTASNPLAGTPPLNPLIALQSSTPELVDPTAPRYTEFSIPQTLIGRAGSTPHVRLLEELVSEPPSPTNTSPLTPLPSPPPHAPIPHYRSLRSSTIWGPYLIKHGGYAKDLKSLDPTCKVKKPCTVLDHAGAEIRGGDQLTNTDTNGRERLTRKMFHQFEKRGHHPLRVTNTI
jgi:hypothetical protein